MIFLYILIIKKISNDQISRASSRGKTAFASAILMKSA